MASKAPDRLSDLCAFEQRISKDTEVLQYNPRRGSGYDGERLHPTPSGNKAWDDPKTENLADWVVYRPVDLIRLSFRAGQIDHFRHDLPQPDFEPLRSRTSIDGSLWRKDIAMHQGCEKLYWGECRDSGSEMIILLICIDPA